MEHLGEADLKALHEMIDQNAAAKSNGALQRVVTRLGDPACVISFRGTLGSVNAALREAVEAYAAAARGPATWEVLARCLHGATLDGPLCAWGAAVAPKAARRGAAEARRRSGSADRIWLRAAE